MQQLKNGRRLLAVLVFLTISGCRTDNPPAKEVCILDGFGGGDCVEADGSKKYRAPSEMVNYWSTNEADAENFFSWCYKTGKSTIKNSMEAIQASVK